MAGLIELLFILLALIFRDFRLIKPKGVIICDIMKYYY